MKKALFLTFGIMTLALGARAQYSGSYTVGGSSPDFSTIQEAADSLSSQGVSGAVSLDIRDGSYTENVVQNHIPGTSISNTVTYQSESGDSSLVLIEATTGSTFTLNNADYLRFKDLRISVAATTDGTSISAYKTSDISIDACSFYGVGTYGLKILNDFDAMSSISITNSKFNGLGGVLVDSTGNVGTISLTNSWFSTDNSCFELNIVGDINSITVENDSLWSTAGNGVSIVGTNLYGTSVTNIYVNANLNGLKFSAGYHNYPTTLQNIVSEGSTNSAIYIQGYDGILKDISASNITVNGPTSNAISLESNQLTENVTLSNIRAISTNGRGGYISGYSTGIKDVTITDCYFQGENNKGLEFDTDETIENVTFLRDSILSISDYLGLDLQGSELVNNISLDYVVCQSDSSSSGSSYSAWIESSDYHLDNVSITNSSFLGNGGLKLESYNGCNFVTIDNSSFHGTYYDGFYLYARTERVGDWSITNSSFTGGGDGCEIYGSDAYFDNIHISDCNFHGMYTGLDIDADDNVEHCSVRNCTVNSEEGYAMDVEAYDGGIFHFVVDSCQFNRELEGTVCAIESNYLNGDSLWITNSSFICDSITVNSWGRALEIEADYGDWNNVWINNNHFEGYEGIEFECDYGGANNAWIENNTITALYRGIYLDGVGTDFHAQYNSIEGVNDTLTYGIYINGSQGVSDNFHVENNHIEDAVEYGISVYEGGNYFIQNNTIEMNASDGTGRGLDFYGLNRTATIKNNQVYADSSFYGLYINNCDFVLADAIVANNFVSGFSNSLYLLGSSSINIYHNSFSSDANAAMIYMNILEDIEIQNNIFSVNNGGAGSIYEMYTDITNTIIDNNAYEFDDASYNFSFGTNINSDLSDWQAATGFGANSFFATPGFMDPYTDLHVDCSSNALNVGLSGLINTDIDGSMRTGNITIGADQIITPGSTMNT
ncbi:MAG: right-handed parallel beta-helix repeat-containing protein, partial [Crocinitomicaceae bacterium]|nr:right-handed parallel beta-helix repeat-containing protein [Crocinitomicaceae bacterium]